MANVTITLSRSDLFPATTVVKAFAGTQASSWSCDETIKETASAEATVSAAGKLEYVALPEGEYTLFAEVGSEPRYLRVGNVAYRALEAARGALKERIRIRREEVGA